MIGESVAHYQINSKLGEGGMGEVYRATDMRLKREVALKILPASFSRDPHRMGRFQREAEVLASLNHPNIAGIYGLEKEGAIHAIAMELVEGETLADRIARAPIPTEEALRIALEIAVALEAAHEKGIIHRDLKPANVIVRPDGSVKVLDFGLAKAAEPAAEPSRDLSHSPTLSMQATQAGIILGTAAYMSPEQAKGKPADRRSDLFSFGVVLFEMLSGRRPFEGEDVFEILASVLAREPDLKKLPANTPPAVKRLLRRLLQKDPANRLHHAADLRLEIAEALEAGSEADVDFVAAQPTRRSPWPTLAIALIGAIIGLVASAVWLRQPAVEEAPRVLQVVSGGGISYPAISPDGRQVAYVRNGRLHLQSLDSPSLREFPEIEGASHPFWSPDGTQIGYFVEREMRAVPVQGGPSLLLASPAFPPWGAAWCDQGVVYGLWSQGLFLRTDSGETRSLAAPDSSAKLRFLLNPLLPERWSFAGGCCLRRSPGYRIDRRRPAEGLAVVSLQLGRVDESRLDSCGTNSLRA